MNRVQRIKTNALLSFLLLAGIPVGLSAQGSSSTKPSKPTPSAPVPQKPKLWRGRHILLSWKGNPYAPPTVTRSKEEAKKLALELKEKLKKGEDFAALAKKFSSGPSRFSGGDLGQFGPGQMIPAFEKAISGAKVGEVVGPIETQFGYHIIRRDEVKKPWPKFVAASHILFSYKGAMRAAPTMKRSEKEARAAAEKTLAELRTGKLSFEKAAKTRSDDPSAKQSGGKLGQQPTRGFPPVFVDALVNMKVGDLSEVVETPFGFHILRKDKIIKPMRASHILIAWKGAMRAGAGVTRTKEAALKLAKEILAKVKTGEDFASAARKFSDGPSKTQGGDLGVFRAGQMIPAFEEACRKAKVGSIVGPVETPFGFHIIKRTQ